MQVLKPSRMPCAAPGRTLASLMLGPLLMADELERNRPNPDASRYLSAGGINWHVQIMGAGPVLLLVHGTGSSTHTWRRLMPILAREFTVVAPDLPGQGLTRDPPASALTLPGMAQGVSALLRELDLAPKLVAGHSAGAAILVQMRATGAIAPKAIISLNGALLPFGGVAGQVFAPLARAMVLNPFVPRFLAWRARDPANVAKLLAETGSVLKDDDIGYYVRLFQDRRHVLATLGMMANWDLNPLRRSLKSLETPLVLVAAGRDKTIAPAAAKVVERRCSSARVRALPGLGHLAHEENPEVVRALIIEVAQEFGVLPPP